MTEEPSPCLTYMRFEMQRTYTEQYFKKNLRNTVNLFTEDNYKEEER